MSRILEKSIIVFSWLCAIILFTGIACIMSHLFLKGAAVVDLQLVFGDTDVIDAVFLKRRVFDGLFPAVAGTFLLVLLSVAIAVPLGLTSGIYLAEYANPKTKQIFSVLCDILAGIPSIVIGLFGFSVSIFLHKYYSGDIYPCLLISSVSLAILVLPYIIRTTQGALESIPIETRLTAPALGATKLQNIVYVLLPKSLTGIFSGLILAIGRCAEDTAVIMLTGVVASAGVPGSVFSHYEALPFYIYYISSQYMDHQELLTGYGASILLLLLCAGLFLIAAVIRKGLVYRAFYRS